MELEAGRHEQKSSSGEKSKQGLRSPAISKAIACGAVLILCFAVIEADANKFTGEFVEPKVNKKQCQSESNINANPSQDYLGADLNVDVAVDVDFDIVKGKYVLEVRRIPGPSNDENERAKQMAHSATTLLIQAELLREMGEQLHAQYRAYIQSGFRKSAPRIRQAD